MAQNDSGFLSTQQKVPPPSEPNPWVTTNPDHTGGVRLFGSHTILVNSVFMFIATIVIIFILGICLMNCTHCPPTFLQNQPFSSRANSFSLVPCDPEEPHGEDPALPGDEVLTKCKDTPVVK